MSLCFEKFQGNVLALLALHVQLFLPKFLVKVISMDNVKDIKINVNHNHL
jgi:hypothetical protein